MLKGVLSNGGLCLYTDVLSVNKRKKNRNSKKIPNAAVPYMMIFLCFSYTSLVNNKIHVNKPIGRNQLPIITKTSNGSEAGVKKAKMKPKEEGIHDSNIPIQANPA